MTVVELRAEPAGEVFAAPRRFDLGRRVLRNGRVRAGLVLLLPIAVLAVLFPFLPFGSATETSITTRFLSPSLDHPLGTDTLGRDMLARTIAGARISLLVGLTVTVVSLLAGIIFGTIAGYFGGWIDSLISGITNILLSFPGLLIGLLLVSVFGPGMWQVVAAVSIAFTPRATRLQRSSVLAIRNRPYMDAARQVSAPSWWILVRHVVPNTLSPMLVVGGIYTADAILIEATISFMGLGIVPPTPSWGTIIKDGQPFLREAWWITMMPAAFLVIVAVGLHLVADGARQIIDPSHRGGRK